MIVIARLTVQELVRRRVVWVLAILTIVSVALVGWGLDRLVDLAREDGTGELEIQIGVSQVLILIAFMFSFVLAMTAAFIGAPAVGGDLESGVAYAILARPLRRTDVLLTVDGSVRRSWSSPTRSRPGCSRSASPGSCPATAHPTLPSQSRSWPGRRSSC